MPDSAPTQAEIRRSERLWLLNIVAGLALSLVMSVCSVALWVLSVTEPEEGAEGQALMVTLCTLFVLAVSIGMLRKWLRTTPEQRHAEAKGWE